MMPGEPGPRPEPTVEDLFSTRRAATPAEVRDELMASMGLGPNPVQRTQEHPGIHELAEDLGLA
jgi:hypothetical protein